MFLEDSVAGRGRGREVGTGGTTGGGHCIVSLMLESDWIRFHVVAVLAMSSTIDRMFVDTSQLLVKNPFKLSTKTAMNVIRCKDSCVIVEALPAEFLVCEIGGI